MKAGIGSYAFRWNLDRPDGQLPSVQDVRSFLVKCADMGAEVVQICDNLPLEHLSSEDLFSLQQQSIDLHLAVELGIKGSHPEHIQKNLEVAQRLNVNILRIVLTTETWTPTYNEIVTILKDFIPDIQQLKISLAVENHFDFTPEILAAMIEQVNSPYIGICLDPFNGVSKLISPDTVLKWLAPYTITAHIKDAVIKRWNTGFYIQGCPLGEGILDIDGMILALATNPYSPNVMIEGWMDRLEDWEDTLICEEEWVRKSIRRLQKSLVGESFPHTQGKQAGLFEPITLMKG